MLLHDYLEQYNLTHDVKPSTLAHYRWVVASFERFAGPTQTEALTADTVNGWLLWLRENGRSPFTTKQRKISLLVLWRSAWREGLAPTVQECRRVRVPEPPRRSWLPEDVSRLVAACASLRGDWRGWWRTFLLAAYETGLRRCDLQQLQRPDLVRGNGSVIVTQIKTGKLVACTLSPSTLDEILDYCPPSRKLIWPWPYRVEAFYRAFQRLAKSAGVQGTFGVLRKTSATEVERERIGTAWLHLGHSSPDTTRKWYTDPGRAYAASRPAPPLPPL
jgi:integrase